MSDTTDSETPPELRRDAGLDAPPPGPAISALAVSAPTAMAAPDPITPDTIQVAVEGDTLDRCLIYGIYQQGLAGLFKAWNLGIKPEHLSVPEKHFYALFEAFVPKTRLPTQVEIRAATGFDLTVPTQPYDVETFGEKIVTRVLRSKLREGLHPIIYEHLVKDPVTARDELQRLVDDTKDLVSRGGWPDPEPLDRESPPPVFPLGTLPGWLQSYVASVADHHEVPVDMPAMLALAAVSGGISKRVVGSLRGSDGSGWLVPANLYIMVAANSGTGKTPVLDRIMRPIRDLESDLWRAAAAAQSSPPPPVHWTAKPDAAEFDPLITGKAPAAPDDEVAA